MRVMETAVMNPPPSHHLLQLLVMKIGKLANRPAADSLLYPPPLPPLGRWQVLRRQLMNVRWGVPFDANGTSNVHVVLRIYVI
jgi:hypothetical protein